MCVLCLHGICCDYYVSPPLIPLHSEEEGMIAMNLGGDGYDGETWLGGVVPQQQEVTRLQEEVGYLKEQCECWKKMAEGCVPADEESEVLLLRTEAEQLRREVEVSPTL